MPPACGKLETVPGGEAVTEISTADECRVVSGLIGQMEVESAVASEPKKAPPNGNLDNASGEDQMHTAETAMGAGPGGFVSDDGSLPETLGALDRSRFAPLAVRFWYIRL